MEGDYFVALNEKSVALFFTSDHDVRKEEGCFAMRGPLSVLSSPFRC